MELIPQARELAEQEGQIEQAAAVTKVIDDILARPEHEWIPSRPPSTVAKTAQKSDDPQEPVAEPRASAEEATSGDPADARATVTD